MTPRYFYVSAIDGVRRYLVAGPYDTHDVALARVDEVSRIACERDGSGRAHFMTWGTAGSETLHKTILGVV